MKDYFLKHCYSHASLIPYLKGYRRIGVTNAQIDLLSHYSINSK